MIIIGLVYVSDDGAVIGINEGKFYIQLKDDVTEVPLHSVSAINIYGNSQMTTQCTRYCLDKNINVSFFSKAGKYVGSMKPIESTDIKRIRLQFARTLEPEFSLVLAKQIILAKINNQITIIRRYKNANIDINEPFRLMQSMKNKINKAASSEEIMGYEGIAAKYYFEILSKTVNPEFYFEGRNRKPPKDPVNAMLSFGYSLLTSEICGELDNVGLNAYAGFLHKEHVGSPALANDLIEEWRPVIVDSTVLSLIQGNEIKASDFDISAEGCYLNHTARKIFLNKLQQKMHTENKYLDNFNKPMTFRLAIFHQAEKIVKAIESDDPSIYIPIKIR